MCRLCFDARGDLDLRQPGTSSAAVVVDRPEHNYHPGGMMQPKLCDLVQTARAEACELWINRRRHTKVRARKFCCGSAAGLEREGRHMLPVKRSKHVVLCMCNTACCMPHVVWLVLEKAHCALCTTGKLLSSRHVPVLEAALEYGVLTTSFTSVVSFLQLQVYREHVHIGS